MSVTHRVTAPLFDTASDFAFGNNLQTFIYDTFLEHTVPQAKRKGYEKADEKKGRRLREPSPLQRKAPLQRQD